MQSKELLQPPALGVDLASAKSEKTVITLSTSHGMKIGDRIKVTNGSWLSGKESKMVVVDELSNGGDKQYTGDRTFKTQEDQALYRQLRKEGMEPDEAVKTMRLLGIEPMVSKEFLWDYDFAADIGTFSKKEPKKKLPHYHGRRRF